MDADKALPHVGHRIECVTYGSPPVNVALECIDCYEVIADADLPNEREDRLARIEAVYPLAAAEARAAGRKPMR